MPLLNTVQISKGEIQMKENSNRIYANAFATQYLSDEPTVSESKSDASSLNYEVLSGFLLVSGVGIGIALPLFIKYWIGL